MMWIVFLLVMDYSSFLLRVVFIFFFFSSRRRHTRYWRDWSSDVCSSDLHEEVVRTAYETADGVVLACRGSPNLSRVQRQPNVGSPPNHGPKDFEHDFWAVGSEDGRGMHNIRAGQKRDDVIAFPPERRRNGIVIAKIGR